MENDSIKRATKNDCLRKCNLKLVPGDQNLNTTSNLKLVLGDQNLNTTGKKVEAHNRVIEHFNVSTDYIEMANIIEYVSETGITYTLKSRLPVKIIIKIKKPNPFYERLTDVAVMLGDNEIL